MALQGRQEALAQERVRQVRRGKGASGCVAGCGPCGLRLRPEVELHARHGMASIVLASIRSNPPGLLSQVHAHLRWLAAIPYQTKPEPRKAPNRLPLAHKLASPPSPC